MVALPPIADPTLKAVDAAIELTGNAQPQRAYLGMSGIGRPCRRALWYDFHWCSHPAFDAATLRRFEDGHRTEDLEAARINKVGGVTLSTIDERTGCQYGYKDLGGHFRGHMDGIVLGLLQAPQTPHVWECKAVNDKKQSDLQKKIAEHGEKSALEKWDGVYYAQALLYMHYGKFKRHYLTCTNPGGRKTISCRTDARTTQAKKLVEKARIVIESPEPLEKLNTDPAYYQCKWCNHAPICHDNQVPAVNCRTCAHSTPELDGDARWSCARYQADIPEDWQRKGCEQHVFNPKLISLDMIDASQAENWVEYRRKDGYQFRNGQAGPHSFTSHEIADASSLDALGDSFSEELRAQFDARFTCETA